MDKIFSLSRRAGINALKKVFLFKKPGYFSHFQIKFDLIIQLVNLLDLDEVRWVTERVCLRHKSQGLNYVEYRMLLPFWLKRRQFELIVSKICHTLNDVNLLSGDFQATFSLGIPREDTSFQTYNWLQKLFKKDIITAKTTVSIDFCHIEEGFPPKNKQGFFELVNKNNKYLPQQALAILYHVGESYRDKSLESAIRWIHQAAIFGAHRLGHAIALGIPPKHYLGAQSEETVEERVDHIDYLLKYHKQLSKNGFLSPQPEFLQEELQELRTHHSKARLQRQYTLERIRELETYQQAVILDLKQRNTCIECCPRSNLLIGMLDNKNIHPIHCFLKQDMNITIGSDDPGILDTTLGNEMEWVEEHTNITSQQKNSILQNMKYYRSEIMSGRRRKRA